MIKPGKMLREVAASLFRKPATAPYPYAPIKLPDRFRGRVVFLPEKCVGCKLCARDCPAQCLTIRKLGDRVFEAAFDLDRCIFCAQCVDSCPKQALQSTGDFELAQTDRRSLTNLCSGRQAAAGVPEPPAQGAPSPGTG